MLAEAQEAAEARLPLPSSPQYGSRADSLSPSFAFGAEAGRHRHLEDSDAEEAQGPVAEGRRPRAGLSPEYRELLRMGAWLGALFVGYLWRVTGRVP